MSYMEPGLGYYYPAGTPGPTEEWVTAYCEKCDWEADARLIRDLGAVDLVVSTKEKQVQEDACPRCGYDAPPLRTRREDPPPPSHHYD